MPSADANETPRPARTSATTVQRAAPAKLNLALTVDAAREDGFHPICTWMVAIDLCDELTITRLPHDRLSRYAVLWHEDARRRCEIDWSVKDDLAVRAHLALEKRVGRPLPVQMKLSKRIPVGGGLGGGSSDAAAMLLAVDELFELGLDAAALLEIAAPLGSDVPFFLRGGSATVRGLGTTIEDHATLPDLDAVVILPEVTCPTCRVYARFDEGPPARYRPEMVEAVIADSRALAARRVFNDLAEAAIDHAPTLREVRDRVSHLAKRPAIVTGSGSSLFVLCDDGSHATSLADAIERTLELVAVTVTAHPRHS